MLFALMGVAARLGLMSPSKSVVVTPLERQLGPVRPPAAPGHRDWDVNVCRNSEYNDLLVWLCSVCLPLQS